jgi:hypothetical protein
VSVYTYPQSKVVDEVTFRKSEGGQTRAYLHASAASDQETLYNISKVLAGIGWKCIPLGLNGKPVLEVRGMKNPAQLINVLERNNWVQGNPAHTIEKEDHVSFKDKLRRRTLQGTGLFFILADIGFTVYGHKEKRWEDTAAGLSYMAGSTEFALFGSSDQSNLEIRRNVRKLIEYAKEHDLKVDTNNGLAHLADDKNKGALKSVHEILCNYPGEVGNTLTALAGALIATSAARHRVFNKFDARKLGEEALIGINRTVKKPDGTASVVSIDPVAFGKESIRKRRLAGKMDMGLGTTTLVSGMLGGWIKEKARDPDAPPSHGVKAVWDWVQERPLRIAGFGYMISTLCHAVSTTVEYYDAKKTGNKQSLAAVPWRGLFITSTIIGEILMTLSSKGHGEGVKNDQSTDDSMIALTAGLIAKQPGYLQEELISHLSKFLGRSDVLARKDGELAQLLRSQVETMQKNPWIKLPQSHEELNESAQVKTTDPRKTSLPAWQAKTLAEKSNSQPQLSV